MLKELICGLLLIAIGVASAWIFCLLGETDCTGCVLIVLFGLFQVLNVIINAIKIRRRKSKFRIDKVR